jgi:hypothetical protein
MATPKTSKTNEKNAIGCRAGDMRQNICSNKLNVDHIERLETNIIETICKLEMIFPPSFVLLNGACTHTFTV